MFDKLLSLTVVDHVRDRFWLVRGEKFFWGGRDACIPQSRQRDRLSSKGCDVPQVLAHLEQMDYKVYKYLNQVIPHNLLSKCIH
jgi:hypothetical protein